MVLLIAYELFSTSEQAMKVLTSWSTYGSLISTGNYCHEDKEPRNRHSRENYYTITLAIAIVV